MGHQLVALDLPVIHTHWEAEKAEVMVVMILMILPLLHLQGNVTLRSNQIEKITHYYEMTPCTNCGVTNFAPWHMLMVCSDALITHMFHAIGMNNYATYA